MRLIVLGSAAGGGVPQWNCGCENCEAARRGAGVQPRTQDCVAVTADEQRWFLLNASPDIARQLERTPALWPSHRRHSPIAGIVLTNDDLDHCLGLLSLREWTPWSLYATAPTLAGLFERNVMLRTLDRQRPLVPRRSDFDGLGLVPDAPGFVARQSLGIHQAPSSLRARDARPGAANHQNHRDGVLAIQRPLALDRSEPLLDANGDETGLTVRAFATPGKVPLHLESMVEPSPAINVGLEITQPQTGARLLHVPAAATLDGLATRIDPADCLLFDGTFWSDDELQRVQASSASARAMAHLPVGGSDGSLEQLSRLATRRIIYTHINNTNPMLREGSAERAAVLARGLEVAVDGMELEL